MSYFAVNGQWGVSGPAYAVNGPQYAIGQSGAMPWFQPQLASGGQALALHGAPMQTPILMHQLPMGMMPQAGVQPVNAFGVPAMPVVQMPQPTIVEQRVPGSVKIQPVPCNITTNVPKGTQQTATVRPQRLFKPERFEVPPTTAPDYLVQIFVGVDLQGPVKGLIAAESFLPDAIYTNVTFDECDPSMDLSVDAFNNGGADRPFFSTFFGKVVRFINAPMGM